MPNYTSPFEEVMKKGARQFRDVSKNAPKKAFSERRPSLSKTVEVLHEVEDQNKDEPADPEVREALKALVLKECKFYSDSIDDESFEILSANWVGRFIFLVVHSLLGVGVYFAIAEFRAAKQLRANLGSETPQEVKVSLEGIAVKSSLHGMMFLAIAFAFYFLYLTYVYPIVVIGAETLSEG